MYFFGGIPHAQTNRKTYSRYMYIHSRIPCLLMYLFLYIYIYVRMYARTFARTYVRMRACMHGWMHVCMYVRIYLCVCENCWSDAVLSMRQSVQQHAGCARGLSEAGTNEDLHSFL